MKRTMTHVQLMGLKRDLEPLLSTLQQLKCVEITPVGAGIKPLPTSGAQVQEVEDLAYLLTRLDSLLATLAPEKPAGSPPPSTADVATIRSDLERQANAVRTLTDQRDALSQEQLALPRYRTTLRKLVPLMPAAARSPDTVTTVVMVSDAHRWVLKNVADQVADLAAGQEQIAENAIGDGLRAMLIVVPAPLAPDLRALLGQREIAQMQLPDAFADMPPDDAVAALDHRLAQVPDELAHLDGQLAALAHRWGDTLWQRRRTVAQRLARLQLRSKLGATSHTFILHGWCPTADLAPLQAALAGHPTIHLATMPPGPEDDVPVALHNPGPIRPFESLVKLMVYPRYRGIDPTPLMALFLPLFFGMILGDIGYAAVIFLAALAGLRRFREPGTLRDLIKVLLIGSVWGAVFGLLYGEAFGTLGEEWGLHALWLERAAPEYVTSLLLFTIGVGVFHVTLGLVLGVWLAWQERQRSHLLERGGMLVGLVGLLLLVGTVTQHIPGVLRAPGVAIMVVGVALLGASRGWLGILLGPIEFVGLLGNILSYLRLAAVGLASVYVALVANELAGSLGSLLLGIIVAVLIHALNIVLGAFSPTIHSLRLQYVEFFRKFYEGGGRPFQPFGSQGT